VDWCASDGGYRPGRNLLLKYAALSAAPCGMETAFIVLYRIYGLLVL
jgi:hypothetical protein